MWVLICEQDTSRLQGSVGKELEVANKRLKELELANKKLSELETANQRLAEMETLLGKKEQMILDLKKLLDDTKSQARYKHTLGYTLRRGVQSSDSVTVVVRYTSFYKLVLQCTQSFNSIQFYLYSP